MKIRFFPKTFRNRARLAALLLFYVICVNSYNNLTQPQATVRTRATTDGLFEYSEGVTRRDMSKVDQFALLSAHIYGGDTLCDKTISEMLPQWKPIEIDEKEVWNNEFPDWYLDFSNGLVWKAFVNTDGSATKIAIVFRGTDGPDDFLSNFRWVTRFIPFSYDQYDIVHRMTPKLLTHIRNKFPGETLAFVSTGHSLGGGLAQQAAYSSDDIKTIYAFDPSSVSGFYDVKWTDNDRLTQRVKDMRIYRIYERGEILAYLRRIMSLLYPIAALNPKITEIRYNFEGLKKNFIELHSMERLSCSLTEVANSYTDE